MNECIKPANRAHRTNVSGEGDRSIAHFDSISFNDMPSSMAWIHEEFPRDRVETVKKLERLRHDNKQGRTVTILRYRKVGKEGIDVRRNTGTSRHTPSGWL